MTEERPRKGALLGVIAYVLVPGERRARAAGHFRKAGFETLKGLAGDNIDCHVGNESTVTAKHAVISWDASLGSFVIQCLSLRTPIFVNGREISFSSPPVMLSSKNLVQIGVSMFYFLLPKTMKT